MQTRNESSFRGAASSVQALVARNLQFLQAIESTLTRLDSDTNLVKAVARGFDEVFDSLKERQNGQMIDSEGTICAALSGASDVAARMYATAATQHRSACDNRALRPDDGVVDAFEAYMDSLRDIHDLVEEIREWIETHDALLEPTTGVTYSTVEDLLAALDAD